MDITLQFNGRMICVPGVTRFTTCEDVIEMVLYRSFQSGDSFSIYENSYGIERRLPGKESIAKIVRSWGADKKKFDLVIRQSDNVKVNVAKGSHARRKLQRMRIDQAQRADVKSKESVTNMNLNKDSKKEMKPKVIPMSAKGSRVRKNRGKVDLMKRFLKDVMSQQDKQTTCVVRSRLPIRTLGDGCSDTESADNEFIRDSAMDTEVDIVNDSESAFEDDNDSSIGDLERNIHEHDVDSDMDSTDKIDSVINKLDCTMVKCEKIRKMFSGSDITNSGSDSEDANMESFMRTVVYDTDSDEGRRTSASD